MICIPVYCTGTLNMYVVEQKVSVEPRSQTKISAQLLFFVINAAHGASTSSFDAAHLAVI